MSVRWRTGKRTKKTGGKNVKGVRLATIFLVVMVFLTVAQPVLACYIDGDINCDGAWGNGNTGGTKAQLIVDATASSSSTGNTVSMHCEKKVGPGDFSWSCNWDEKLPWATDWVFSGQASFSGPSGSDTVVLGGGPLECGEPPRLKISHVSCKEPCPSKVEAHFRMVHLPENVVDYGTISYSMTMPNGSVYNGTAGFDGVTGDGAHYFEHIDIAGSANGVYDVTSGSVTLTFAGGQTLTINLDNPGPFEVTDCSCPPSGCNEPPSENGCEAGLIEYQGLCRDTNCPTESTCSCPDQTLGLTSSLYCEESTGLWHLSKGISNLSTNRTYEVTIQVGSKTDHSYLGPGQSFSVEKTAKEGTILSWWIWVGGKVFAQGTEGPFGPCGEVPFVPEWSTLTLLGGGLSGLVGYIKRRSLLMFLFSK